MGRKIAGARAAEGIRANAGALPMWQATYGNFSVEVDALLWYDARNEAARLLCASPLDVICVARRTSES